MSNTEYRTLLNKDCLEDAPRITPICNPIRFTIATLSTLVGLLMILLFCVVTNLSNEPTATVCGHRDITENGGDVVENTVRDKYSTVGDEQVRENKSNLIQKDRLGLIADIHLALPDVMRTCATYNNIAPSNRFASLYGVSGCDSTLSLVDRTMASLASNLGTISPGVLFLGDGVVHQNSPWDNHLALTTLGELFNLFDKHFPRVSVVSCIGNNDIKERATLPDKEWYDSLIDWYKTAALRGEGSQLADDFHRTFLSGGYYSVKLTQNLRVISLHTNYFSVNIDKNKQRIKAYEQLKWLNETLNRLSGPEKAIIIGHHPPGLSLYSLLYQQKVKANWWIEYFELFRSICSPNTDKITGMFFGHCHEDSFAVETIVHDQMISTFSIPSVAPIYQGQPSYVIADLDANLTMVDMETWFTWLDYYIRKKQVPKFISSGSLSGVLGVSNLTSSQLATGAQHIIEEGNMDTHIVLNNKFYQNRSSPDLPPHLHYCFVTNISKSEFIKCLELYGYDAKSYVVNS